MGTNIAVTYNGQTIINEEISATTLTNIIPSSASEFSSGWSGGKVSSTRAKSGSTSYQITATSSDVEKVCPLSINVSQVQNHIYYVSIYEYHESSVTTGQFQMYWPIEEPFAAWTSFGSANQWNKLSQVFSRTNWASGSKQLRIDFNNNYSAGSVWYDCLVLIDLTAAFGSGNEPSKEWCDANIPYFTGETSLPLHISYNGSSIATIAAGETKTLNCSGKYMNGNITVGNKTLNCSDTVMSSNVVVSLEQTGETWYLNSGGFGYTTMSIDVEFTSNGESFNHFEYRYVGGKPSISYTSTGGSYVSAYYAGTWYNQAYRTIVLAQLASGSFLTWLQSNATKQS